MSAFLDVTELLIDPELVERSSFTVNRRTEVVDNHGRSTLTSVVHTGVLGVVCSASSNDLIRLPDDQKMGRNMSIVTKFHLQGPSPGFQADTVVWHGDTFVVKYVDVYSQFGGGFIQAIVGSMDSQDAPP